VSRVPITFAFIVRFFSSEQILRGGGVRVVAVALASTLGLEQLRRLPPPLTFRVP